METHAWFVYVAKTFGLLWMMGVFLVVLFLAYRPSAKARHDRAARSILPDEQMAEDRP